jgi:hypothetical protein
MSMMTVKKNEATAALRRMRVYCVDATDGMTPENGEAGGQPQISVDDGVSWTDSDGVLVLTGNGWYYVQLTQAEVNLAGRSVITGRYKSANTAEAIVIPIQIEEYPVDASAAAIKTQTDKFLFDASNYVKSTPQTAVTISAEQVTAGVLTTAVTEGDEVSWPRGDADRLTVDLGSAYAKAGARFYLCIKADKAAANSTAIVNRECTITDAANVVGYIDLTALEMAVVGKYYAEIERRDADGTSNPRTCWAADWRIPQDVRQ